MLLRHSLDLEEEARAVEEAVHVVLSAGYRTADLVRPDQKAVTTQEMGDLVSRELVA
jgi:3-isopropylmalate dehydrogenase